MQIHQNTTKGNKRMNNLQNTTKGNERMNNLHNTTNGNKRMNNIRSTMQRVALALLLAVSLSGLALLRGGAPVSHAAPAYTISATNLPASGQFLVKGYFNPGDRVALAFYTGPSEEKLHVLFSRTVYAWTALAPGLVYDTEPESNLPNCQTIWVQAYDYNTRLYSNWASAPNTCITINPNGIGNGADFSPNEISAGGVVSIFGTGFVSPDTVLVRQGIFQYTIQAGSPWWYDSPNQINALLPATLAPGQATVYVRNAAGLLSNGQAITVHLPTINPNGIGNGANYSPNDIYAGTTVSIFGTAFEPTDIVLVDQGSRTYSITAGSPWWYDSPTQINATLPGTLVPGLATVYVLNVGGVRSNGQTITIQ
jgi:hypothetical protein